MIRNFIKKHWVALILLFVFIMALCIYYFYVSVEFWHFSRDSKEWANFGSYAAGIFTGITFLGILYQLYLLKENQAKQNFERNFFMMLEQHNATLRYLESKDSGDKEKSFIDLVYSNIDSINSFFKIRKYFSGNDNAYSAIDVYFINLYRILKYIYENKQFNGRKKHYSGLLRSYLSRKLLLILAYHLCQRSELYDDYIKYVNEFSMLEHLNLSDLEVKFISELSGVPKNQVIKAINDKPGGIDDYYDDGIPYFMSCINKYKAIHDSEYNRISWEILIKMIVNNGNNIDVDDLLKLNNYVSNSSLEHAGIKLMVPSERGWIDDEENGFPVIGDEDIFIHPIQKFNVKDSLFIQIINRFDCMCFNDSNSENIKRMKEIYAKFIYKLDK